MEGERDSEVATSYNHGSRSHHRTPSQNELSSTTQHCVIRPQQSQHSFASHGYGPPSTAHHYPPTPSACYLEDNDAKMVQRSSTPPPDAGAPWDLCNSPGSPAVTLIDTPGLPTAAGGTSAWHPSEHTSQGVGNADRKVATDQGSLRTRRSQSEVTAVEEARQPKQRKPMQFWFIFATLAIVMFLSAIDLTIISTALPTIVKDLPTSTISPTWMTSSFLLTVTAFQPLMGGLADVLGRRNSLLLSIAFFLGGSIICALARSMLILVVGRGVQGVGGGGIQAIIEIIISDITTLRERGLYMGFIGLVFAISSLIAPILGGVFSRVDWRWIFWINLPIGGVAAVLCIPFLTLQTPPMALKDKIRRMDIFANLILFGSVVGILIGVTEGGVQHPWSDRRVWAPMVAGIIGLVIFFIVEFVPNRLASDPILPLRLFAHPTAAISFFLTFVHGVIFYGAVYILPVYFQAIKDASPLQSAFDILPSTSPSAPAAVLAGLIMAITGKYKIQMITWWVVMLVGFIFIFFFDVGTAKWQWVCSQLVTGIGVGAIFALTLPPIQACLPFSEIAHATATFAFSRSFGSVWGIAFATAIFTATVSNELQKVPGTAELGLTGQTALGFATELNTLPPELKEPVRHAFAKALRWAFLLFIPLCVVGTIASLFLKDVPLPDFNDSAHGLGTGSNNKSPAKAPDSRHVSLTIVPEVPKSSSLPLHSPEVLDSRGAGVGTSATLPSERRSTSNVNERHPHLEPSADLYPTGPHATPITLHNARSWATMGKSEGSQEWSGVPQRGNLSREASFGGAVTMEGSNDGGHGNREGFRSPIGGVHNQHTYASSSVDSSDEAQGFGKPLNNAVDKGHGVGGGQLGGSKKSHSSVTSDDF